MFWKSDCIGCVVLLCLVVCLTLLASFFLLHLSLKYTPIRTYPHMHIPPYPHTHILLSTILYLKTRGLAVVNGTKPAMVSGSSI